MMTMPERRFPKRLYVSDPGKSYLWFVGVENRLGSRRSMLLKPIHETEHGLSPALSQPPSAGLRFMKLPGTVHVYKT